MDERRDLPRQRHPFGLGASIHTDNPARAEHLANHFEVGMLSINEAGGGAPELPFGGTKPCGFGRELGSYGLTEFVNHKLIRTASLRL